MPKHPGMSIRGRTSILLLLFVVFGAFSGPRSAFADNVAPFRLEYSYEGSGKAKLRREKLYKVADGKLKFVLEAVYDDASSKLREATLTDSSGRKHAYEGSKITPELKTKIQEISGRAARVQADSV